MKKLILLTLLVLTTLNVFSQKDTNNITLNTSVAKSVVKDLIRGDGCQQEVFMLNEKIKLMDSLVYQKDSAISVLFVKDNNNRFEIDMKNKQISLYEELTSNLKQELKNQRKNKFFFQLSTIALTLSSLFILINN